MLKIFNVQVYGLNESCVASGYPMKNSVAKWTHGFLATEDDFKRMEKLGNLPSNSGHGNALTGIIVQFDMTYPEYFSPEFQRYHFAQIISSQSKMHRLSKMNIKDCCNKYVSSDIITVVEKYQKEYNEHPTYENYMKLLSNTPLGFEKTMRISTNYMQLLTIYNQRKNHTLKEDWGTFCNWISTLPKFVELTGIAQIL